MQEEQRLFPHTVPLVDVFVFRSSFSQKSCDSSSFDIGYLPPAVIERRFHYNLHLCMNYRLKEIETQVTVAEVTMTQFFSRMFLLFFVPVVNILHRNSSVFVGKAMNIRDYDR